MSATGYTDLQLYRRLLAQARPYWLHIFALLLLSVLSTPLVLLAPLPLKIAVDSVVGTHPLPGPLDALLPAGIPRSPAAVLIVAAVLLVVVALGKQLQELSTSLLKTYTGEKLVLEFRARLFRHGQRLSLGYHDTKGTADSIYRIQKDAAAVQHIAIDGVIPLVTATFTLVAMMYVTARLDWQLALVALTVSPILFVISRAYKQRLRTQWREVAEIESSALAVVQEVLTAMRVVKAFGQEEREEQRFLRRSGESVLARLRLAVVESGFGLLVGLTTTLGTAVALVIGIGHVRAGVLTLGELLLVMSYLSQLYAPLRTLSRKVVSIQSHLTSAERAFTLLDELPDVVERPDARPLGRAEGAVSFRHVSFGYVGDRPVLHDVSFELEPGTRLGISGTTGAGKTTLVSLLSRFYDPTAGQIVLDGTDLRDYRLGDLRNQFGIVLQEPILFSTSIAENIAYARPGASDADIIAAAKAANAHDFIVRLPEGYRTLVGERGMRLSGGERQRISLARAFLKDAPVLILDEPTSSVDQRTEAVIIDAMERLMRGRTALIIAHRPATLARCDAWLHIENGRVVEPAVGSVAAPAAPVRPGGADA